MKQTRTVDKDDSKLNEKAALLKDETGIKDEELSGGQVTQLGETPEFFGGSKENLTAGIVDQSRGASIEESTVEQMDGLSEGSIEEFPGEKKSAESVVVDTAEPSEATVAGPFEKSADEAVDKAEEESGEESVGKPETESGEGPEAESGKEPEAESGEESEAEPGEEPEAESGEEPEAESGEEPEAESGEEPEAE